MDDAAWLERAIALAVDNARAGGRPFGALVVRGGEVVASGVNRALADDDPTAHAEIVAIREACRRLGTLSLEGATMVASCRPCPMCQAAGVTAGIARTIYAATPAEAGRAGFDSTPVAEELARPPAERRAPLLHVPVASAAAPFDAWLARERA